MKSATLVVLLLTGAAAVSPNFETYKEKFNKHYADDAAESHAEKCWEGNVQLIKNHDDLSVQLGENEFSDQCWEDFKNSRFPSGGSNGICYKTPIPAYNPPIDEKKEVDWVSKGAVTPVKNQASCGSCWAFSATGAMEGANFLHGTGKLLSFSEQELVSCDVGAQDNGCKGGGPDTAFGWVVKQGGIALEPDYPYTGKDDRCDSSKETKKGFFKGFTYVDSRAQNENKLLGALQTEGPISIVVDATNVWQQYHGGIVTASGCGKVSGTDHAVLAVGYGFDNGQAYYRVKNSWGTSWGESGFIRLAYGQNTCNCAKCFSYFPTVDKNPPPSPPPGPSPPSPPGPSPPPSPPSPPSPPPTPPSPPPFPPSPPGPANCGAKFKQADCEAAAVDGCHWCPKFGMGMCFNKEMQCPGSSNVVV